MLNAKSIGYSRGGSGNIAAKVMEKLGIADELKARTRFIDGLPVGFQIIGRHHTDALLLDLARVMERERPWPLVAPGAPV